MTAVAKAQPSAPIMGAATPYAKAEAVVMGDPNVIPVATDVTRL